MSNLVIADCSQEEWISCRKSRDVGSSSQCAALKTGGDDLVTPSAVSPRLLPIPAPNSTLSTDLVSSTAPLPALVSNPVPTASIVASVSAPPSVGSNVAPQYLGASVQSVPKCLVLSAGSPTRDSLVLPVSPAQVLNTGKCNTSSPSIFSPRKDLSSGDPKFVSGDILPSPAPPLTLVSNPVPRPTASVIVAPSIAPNGSVSSAPKVESHPILPDDCTPLAPNPPKGRQIETPLNTFFCLVAKVRLGVCEVEWVTVNVVRLSFACSSYREVVKAFSPKKKLANEKDFARIFQSRLKSHQSFLLKRLRDFGAQEVTITKGHSPHYTSLYNMEILCEEIGSSLVDVFSPLRSQSRAKKAAEHLLNQYCIKPPQKASWRGRKYQLIVISRPKNTATPEKATASSFKPAPKNLAPTPSVPIEKIIDQMFEEEECREFQESPVAPRDESSQESQANHLGCWSGLQDSLLGDDLKEFQKFQETYEDLQSLVDGLREKQKTQGNFQPTTSTPKKPKKVKESKPRKRKRSPQKDAAKEPSLKKARSIQGSQRLRKDVAKEPPLKKARSVQDSVPAPPTKPNQRLRRRPSFCCQLQ